MDSSSDIHRVVDRLLGLSVVDAARHELEPTLVDVRAVRSFADAVEATVLARLAELASQGCSASPAEVLAGRGHRSSRDARAAEARAGVCHELPAFHDALGSGAISAGHVDAVARATAQLDDDAKGRFAGHADELVAAAAASPVDDFARHCRDLARDAAGDDGLTARERQRAARTVSRYIDHDTGMAITRLALDPATDGRMWNAITRAVRTTTLSGVDDGRSWDHITVDTIVDRLSGTTTATAVTVPDDTADDDGGDHAPTPETRLAEIAYLIDADALRNDTARAGVVSETVDGQPVPVATIRRLACNAGIVPIVLGGNSEVLDLGRSRRLASPAQRQALAVMYTHCGFPGCDVPYAFTEAHHTTDWTTHHGPTDLDKLLPLCQRDHHRVHEGGWHLELRPDRTITVTRPDGIVHYEGTSLDRRRPPPTAAAG